MLSTCDGQLREEVLKEGVHTPQAALLQSLQDGGLMRMRLKLHGQVHCGSESAHANIQESTFCSLRS